MREEMLYMWLNLNPEELVRIGEENLKEALEQLRSEE